MKLTNAQLKAFDEWLFDYQYVDKKIAERKLELQTPTVVDENVGGGKSNVVYKVTEEIVIKWDKDERIKSLLNFKSAVQSTLSQLDDELISIFELRWGRGSCNTWSEIAHKNCLSLKSVYRKREKIIAIFAEKIGL